MVRCFVGYLLPDGVKKEIVDLQNKMGEWPLLCKMVERENLHINFSFLGEIDENEIKNISEKMDAIARGLGKIEIEVDGLEAIPSESYIRVLALSVLDNRGMLKVLFEEIKKHIGGDSKPPHVTLCRVRGMKNKNELKEKLGAANINHISLTIEAIQLIKSDLNRAGPVYSIIHESKFA